MSEPHPPVFRRAVIALTGSPTDARIVRLTAALAKTLKASVVAVHVVEIDWTLPLDADVANNSEEAQQVLDMAEAAAESVGGTIEPVAMTGPVGAATPIAPPTGQGDGAVADGASEPRRPGH